MKERKEWKERQVLHALSHMYNLGFECECSSVYCMYVRVHVCVRVCMHKL